VSYVCPVVVDGGQLVSSSGVGDLTCSYLPAPGLNPGGICEYDRSTGVLLVDADGGVCPSGAAQGDTYSVTYNGNGPTSGTVPVDTWGPYGTGATVTVLGPGTLTETGYTFVDWNTSANGSGASYSPSDTFSMPASDVTLFAIWTANPTATITFNSEGGSAVARSRGLEGTTITLPAAPTYARHSFDGWFAARTGGSALSSPYLLSGSVTLYAQWTAYATTTLRASATVGTWKVLDGLIVFRATLTATSNEQRATGSLVGWSPSA
jgi:uncharacterized repeat protein (TIGR02543 family)